MSEFCHHFPSSPRYTIVVLVSGPATPAIPDTVPEVETEPLRARMDSGKRSMASTLDYLVFMKNLDIQVYWCFFFFRCPSWHRAVRSLPRVQCLGWPVSRVQKPEQLSCPAVSWENGGRTRWSPYH